jgi:hypothetical protein
MIACIELIINFCDDTSFVALNTEEVDVNSCVFSFFSDKRVFVDLLVTVAKLVRVEKRGERNVDILCSWLW